MIKVGNHRRIVRALKAGMILVAPGGGVRSWMLAWNHTMAEARYLRPATIEAMERAGLLEFVYQHSSVHGALLTEEGMRE